MSDKKSLRSAQLSVLCTFFPSFDRYMYDGFSSIELKRSISVFLVQFSSIFIAQTGDSIGNSVEFSIIISGVANSSVRTFSSVSLSNKSLVVSAMVYLLRKLLNSSSLYIGMSSDSCGFCSAKSLILNSIGTSVLMVARNLENSICSVCCLIFCSDSYVL